jgi:hypothetical protein
LLLAVVSAIALGSALLSVLLRQEGNEAVDVANQLTLPSQWPLVSEVVEPDRVICLGDNPCPSISRRWRAPDNISTDGLFMILMSSGWNLRIDGSCEPRPNGPTTFRSCSARGQVEGFNVIVSYDSSEAKPAASTLTLNVR